MTAAIDWARVLPIAVPLVVFVCLNIVLSAAGSAMLGASRSKLHHWERHGSGRISRLVEITADRTLAVAAIRLARLIVTVLATIFATLLAVEIDGGPFVIALSCVIIVVVAVVVDLVSRIAVLRRPERAALRFLPVTEVCRRLMSPPILTAEWLMLVPGRLADRRGEEEDGFSVHDELRETVDLLHREGEVVKSDRDMMGGVLDLSELTLADVMIHRTKMETVNIDTTVGDLAHMLLLSPYTRHPVWHGRSENIVGVVHTKDVLKAIERVGGKTERVELSTLVSPPWFVPDVTSAGEQLRAFLKRKIHMALVVDEYGDVQGLVTLEDILEEIVGDISDEQDVVVEGVRRFPDGSASVDGQVPIRDLNRMMDWRLPDEEATTIAGLVIHEARMIPDPGQSFTFHGFRFHVLRKQRNRIVALKVTPIEALRPEIVRPAAGAS